jgi:hypothetical protein
MDAQPDVKSIYERVEQLEKQNRWMRAMGAVAILAVMVLLVSGRAKVDTRKTVEANEFILRDANGAVRAKLGMGVAFLMKMVRGSCCTTSTDRKEFRSPPRRTKPKLMSRTGIRYYLRPSHPCGRVYPEKMVLV